MCAKANYKLLLEIAYSIDCFSLDDNYIVQKIKWLSSDTRLWVYNGFIKRTEERCRCIAEVGLEYYIAHHIVESANRSGSDSENDENLRLVCMSEKSTEATMAGLLFVPLRVEIIGNWFHN